MYDAVGSPRHLHLIGDHRVVAAFEPVEHLIDRCPIRSREDDHRAAAPQLAEKERQDLQPEEGQQGRGARHDIHVRSGRQTDSGRGP